MRVGDGMGVDSGMSQKVTPVVFNDITVRPEQKIGPSGLVGAGDRDQIFPAAFVAGTKRSESPQAFCHASIRPVNLATICGGGSGMRFLISPGSFGR